MSIRREINIFDAASGNEVGRIEECECVHGSAPTHFIGWANASPLGDGAEFHVFTGDTVEECEEVIRAEAECD